MPATPSSVESVGAAFENTAPTQVDRESLKRKFDDLASFNESDDAGEPPAKHSQQVGGMTVAGKPVHLVPGVPYFLSGPTFEPGVEAELDILDPQAEADFIQFFAGDSTFLEAEL